MGLLKTIDKVAYPVLDATLGNVGKGAKKLFLKKEAEKTFKNLGTGYTTTWAAGIAAAGVVGGVSIGASKFNGAMNGNYDGANAQYYGNMPEYAYDATGQVDRKTGDKSLGASGDLVFGLNSSRHGR